MMIVAVYFLMWLPALFGWGTWIIFIRRMFGMAKPESYESLDVVFGIAALTTVAIILNFVLPITSGWVIAALVIGCGLYLWRCRRVGIPVMTGSQVIVAVIIILILSFIASRLEYGYDAGFYHLPTVKWISESALPFGLVNLHGRFGFNSSWLPLAALTRFEFADRYFFGGSALLLSVCALKIAQAIQRLRSDEGWRASNIFMVLIAMAVTAWPVRVNVSSPGSDLPVFVLTLLVTYLMLSAFEQPGQMTYYLCATTVLALFTLTIKYSAAPLVLMPLSLFLAAYRQRLPLYLKRLAFLAIILGAMLVLPWIARSTIVSGCIVYPVLSTCLPVQWSAPVGLVETEITIIRSWARIPAFPTDLTMVGWNWVLTWLRKFLTSPDIVILAPLFVSGSAVLAFKRNRSQSFYLIWIVGPLMLGILFWFFGAPDLRFGAGYFWAITLCVLSIGIQRAREASVTNAIYRALRNIWLGGIALWVSAFAILIFVLTDGANLFKIQSVSDVLWTLPYLPAPELSTQATQSGVILNVVSQDCWLAPVPCTPYFNSNLRLQPLADGRLMFWFDSYILETSERLIRQP